jgi:hypothetical protein
MEKTPLFVSDAKERVLEEVVEQLKACQKR